VSVGKVVHVVGTDRRVKCCWVGPGADSCERDGLEMYKIVVPGRNENIHYVFCSERHLDYFRHSHLAFGMLPPGSRRP
jgi:hypothetical protein